MKDGVMVNGLIKIVVVVKAVHMMCGKLQLEWRLQLNGVLFNGQLRFFKYFS